MSPETVGSLYHFIPVMCGSNGRKIELLIRMSEEKGTLDHLLDRLDPDYDLFVTQLPKSVDGNPVSCPGCALTGTTRFYDDLEKSRVIALFIPDGHEKEIKRMLETQFAYSNVVVIENLLEMLGSKSS